MIPSRNLVRLLLLLLLAAVVGALTRPLAGATGPELDLLWLAAAAALLVVAVADGLAAWQPPGITVRRTLPASLPLGVSHAVRLRISNATARARAIEVFDHHPPHFDVRGLPQRVTVPAGGWTECTYEVRPIRRGDQLFGRTDVRVDSPLRLWARRLALGEPGVTRVYPNFAALTRYALLALDNRLSQIGILQRRRRGEGLEFHQLRDYREGDALRSIDWKATTRLQRLIAREYQDERDQQIVLLIDCGRRMAAHDGELSHFDHVLNAALLLAYVCLRQGDAVGFMTTSGVERFLAPRKSAATVSVMLNRLYDLHPTAATTDYYRAALELSSRLRKRALVVVLSNLRDEDDDTLAPALELLSARHLVLFASLREHVLTRALHARVSTFDRALTHAAAAGYLENRALALRRVARSGAVVLDVEPEQLPVALVNRYLEVKRSGRL